MIDVEIIRVNPMMKIKAEAKNHSYM